MMTQAWNIYSFAIPIVQQFFGIQPLAAKKKVVISPQMPEAWPKASLENVVIADNAVSVFYETIDKGYKIKVTSENPGWEIVLKLRDESEEKGFMVMSSEVGAEQQDGSYIFQTSENVLEVTVTFEP